MRKNNKAFINLTLLGLSLILSWSLIDYFISNSRYKVAKAVNPGACEYVKWPSAELNAIPLSYSTSGAVLVTSSPIYVQGGNIGIGIVDPQYKLHVNGTIFGNTVSSSQICLNGTCKNSWPTEGTGYWNLSGNNLFVSSTDWNIGIGVTSTISKLHIRLPWSPVYQSGFYLEYTTSSGALTDLDIYPSKVFEGFTVLRSYTGNLLLSSMRRMFLRDESGVLGLALKEVTTSVSYPIYDNNGNFVSEGRDDVFFNYVGIGTTSPQYKLHVIGTTSVSALCFDGKDCRSSWPTSNNTLWNISANKVYLSSTEWNVAVGATIPQGKFYVKSNFYLPGVFEVANPDGSGAVLEIRKSFTTSTNEDPYLIFSKQTSVNGSYQKFGYIQGGEGGLRIVPEKFLINVTDPIRRHGRRAYRQLTAINPYGGNVEIGSQSSTANLNVWGVINTDNFKANTAFINKNFYIKSAENNPFSLDYINGTFKMYFDQLSGFNLENNLNDVSRIINPRLKDKITITPKKGSVGLTIVDNNNSEILVGVGVSDPHYSLDVKGTANLTNLIVSNNISVGGKLDVSKINYSRGISVYKIVPGCEGAGYLTTDSQCRLNDGRLINNQYVGKLIE